MGDSEDEGGERGGAGAALLPGMGDADDEDHRVDRPATGRRRLIRRNRLQERLLEESRMFQPNEVDSSRCQALKNANLQCFFGEGSWYGLLQGASAKAVLRLGERCSSL